MGIQKKFQIKFSLETEEDEEAYASNFLKDDASDPAVYSVDNPMQNDRTYRFYLFSVIKK